MLETGDVSGITTSNTHNPKLNDTMITPQKAASLAFNIDINLQLALSAISTLQEQVEKLKRYTEETCNEHAIPRGCDIDDIPETPFQVVFDPHVDDEYKAIMCRGVDVSEFVSDSVEADAFKIVKEAFETVKPSTAVHP